MPQDFSKLALPHIVQVDSVRQTSLNSFYSSNFSLMNVTSQFFPGDFGSVTFWQRSQIITLCDTFHLA